MAKKPVTVPKWATSSESKIIEPLESIKKSGWRYQDAPSSQVVNWWMNAVYQWQRYFEQITDEAWTLGQQQGVKLGNHQSELGSLKDRLKKLEEEFKNHRCEAAQPPPEESREPIQPLPPRPSPIPIPFPFPNPVSGPRPNPIFRPMSHNREDE